ncbi:MAG: ABC transporter ATP-binding protein [Actinobacteria bacterium]|nr:ABC transporter ATP-binding protein [Actinomycetota bacterium]MCA1721851.1 ABC transporter ATP-binding protein [Actinomycetota bacterium]
MSRRPLALLAAATLAAVPLAVAAPAQAADAPYTLVPLTFATTVGPNDDQKCSVVGNLYLPAGTPTGAALLTTNGFGGSKDNEGTQGNNSFAKQYASRGYVALSYSGLGFGGSGCLIELDDPDWDGKAGDQLAQFLGGRPGIATTADGKPYTLPAGLVKTQAGKQYDPVVGMIGGSYGGEVQFATAKYGRIDALVPQITWNDLSYSLAPNNTSQQRKAPNPYGVTYATPGTEKVGWTSLFFALGFTQPLSNSQPGGLTSGCPGFDRRACVAKADLDLDGAPDADTLAFARHASVATYLDDIKVPVLLSQGQSDTLFNLQESIATYAALEARGVPVKMVWQKWGHSDSKPAPGELDARLAPSATYLGQMYADWFDHWLLGQGPVPSLDTEYFRDYAKGTGKAAYASAPGYPVAPTKRLYLSGSDALTSDPSAVADGSAQFASVVPAGAPTSFSEIPVVDQSDPVFDAPGTFAQWTTKPLTKDLEIAGVPAVTVQINAPTFAASSAAGPTGQLVLFAKLYDTAPDGTVTLQHRLVAAQRIAELSKPVRLELPGVVQRIPAGHTLSLVLAASDSDHRGNTLAGPATVTTSKASPGVLELPVLSGLSAVAAKPVSAPAGTTPQAPGGSLPTTGGSGTLPVAALALLGGMLVVRRRTA